MEVSPVKVLGFYTVDQVEEETGIYMNQHNQKVVTALNVSKVLGYLPIIGTIVGIALLYFELSDDKATRNQFGNSFVNWFNARSVVTLFSIGAVFIIPDIIATIANHLFKSDEQAESW